MTTQKRAMRMYKTPITQDMLDATGEPVEQVFVEEDIVGLLFLQVAGGHIRIYNPDLKQALKRRFESVGNAREFALAKLTNREVA